MKRDIRKAVEEIKSAGMEDFLHQDPSTFDCDDDCTTKIECGEDCNCPNKMHSRETLYVRYKMYACKKWTFVTKCTRVRVQNGRSLRK